MTAIMSGALPWTLVCLLSGVLVHRRVMMNQRTFAKDAVYVPLAKLLDSATYALSLLCVCDIHALRPGLLDQSGLTTYSYPITQGLLTGYHRHACMFAACLLLIIFVISIKLEAMAFQFKALMLSLSLGTLISLMSCSMAALI